MEREDGIKALFLTLVIILSHHVSSPEHMRLWMFIFVLSKTIHVSINVFSSLILSNCNNISSVAPYKYFANSLLKCFIFYGISYVLCYVFVTL